MELKQFNKTILTLIGSSPCPKLEEALREYYWNDRYIEMDREVEEAKAAERFINELNEVMIDYVSK